MWLTGECRRRRCIGANATEVISGHSKRGSGGAVFTHWSNMTLVRPEDVIFSTRTNLPDGA